MLDLSWAIVGGALLIAVMGAILFVVCYGIVELFDWVWGAIEAVLKREANRW